MSQEPPIATFDGLGVRARGDSVTVVYGNDARIERTRWLFDQLETLTNAKAQGVLVHLIVLPNSGPPDGATRQENATRMKKMGSAVRRLVTTPLGDGLQVSVVRTIMRGLAIVSRQSNHFVANNVEQGIDRCRDGASKDTPSTAEMHDDYDAIMRALGKSSVAP